MRWGWIITLPLTIFIVLFAIMNREAVHVELWPWPWDIDMPLYMLIGIAVVIGLIVGTVGTWVSAAGQRRKIRELRQTHAALASELKELKASLQKVEIRDQ